MNTFASRILAGNEPNAYLVELIEKVFKSQGKPRPNGDLEWKFWYGVHLRTGTNIKGQPYMAYENYNGDHDVVINVADNDPVKTFQKFKREVKKVIKDGKLSAGQNDLTPLLKVSK